MIVCICKRVSDRTIRNAIADGAETIEQVGAACHAGTGCGACHEMIAEMLSEPLQTAHCSRVHLTVLSPYLQVAGETG